MNEGFDLEAYMARIGHAGSRAPTLSTLEEIHARHPETIPFENLDPLLGRPVRIDIASLQAKLLGERRGGYCFEHNTLLGATLDALGFCVTRLAGRVRWMAPAERPDDARTYMLLRVDLAEGPYLVDVGFGAHLLAAPLRLEREIEQATPASVLRLVGADQIFTLQTRLPAGWQDVYRFTLEPQLAADYEMANWFASTHPSVLFRSNLLAERLTRESRHILFNTRLTRHHHGGGIEERSVVSAGDLGDVLETVFHITPPVDPAEIWARIPKA